MECVLCDKGIITRGCSGGNGSDDSRVELGRDVGKELPRAEPVVFMLFGASKPKSTAGNLPSMRMLRRYLRDNKCSTNVLSFKTHCDIARGSGPTVEAKELPRTEPVVCMLFGASKPKSTAGNLPSMGIFRGYLRDNHCSANVLSISVLFLTSSKSCHLRITYFIEDE